MHIVSYRRGEDRWRAGILREALLVDLLKLGATGQAVPDSVRGLLEAGPGVVGEALSLAAAAFEEKIEGLIAVDDVELGPPVPDPDKIICLGLNYREHAAEVKLSVSPVPTFFAKYRNALTGPRSPIILPRVSRRVDYEGELAFVIGRRCKDVPEEEALGCVAGYSIMNDVSARDLQMQTSQWTAGKTPDTFAPMGPGIVPSSEIPDPQTLRLTTRVNGVVLQDANTRDMVFPVARTIAFLSSIMTLEPGDIVATGTPSGVGFRRKPPVFLKPGDVVEVEVERIGMIRNRVVGT